MRHLSTLIIFGLIIGFGHIALANGGPAPGVQAEKNAKPCTSPQSLGQKGKPKQDTTTTTEVIEAEEVVPKAKEVNSPAIIAGKNSKEEVSGAKKESNSLTFNFLYYIFYKFSVSDFFQTPSYNDASGL